MLTLEDGKKLIKLARASISGVFKKEGLVVNKDIKNKYKEKQGVFVTLKIGDELRGCIGFPEPTYELWKAVVSAAKSAAFEDPRFSPLTEEEYKNISIDISILTVPQLIRARTPEDYLKAIKIGRDGLIIRAGVYSGLLLPQVPVSYGWDAETFLRHTCMKAGITMDAWRDTSHQIYKFQAQIFKEQDGEVVEG